MAALLAKALAIAVVINAPCPMYPTRGACAVPPATVYVPASGLGWATVPLRPGTYDPRRALWHELGHVIDYNLLTDADRGTFLALTHQPGRPWRDPGDSMPAEQFAEAVRHCARSMRWPDHYYAPGAGYYPSRTMHRKVCRWLTGLGAHY